MIDNLRVQEGGGGEKRRRGGGWSHPHTSHSAHSGYYSHQRAATAQTAQQVTTNNRKQRRFFKSFNFEPFCPFPPDFAIFCLFLDPTGPLVSWLLSTINTPFDIFEYMWETPLLHISIYDNTRMKDIYWGIRNNDMMLFSVTGTPPACTRTPDTPPPSLSRKVLQFSESA